MVSQHSLRTTDYDALLVNLRIHAIHATKILSYYGSRMDRVNAQVDE